MWQDEPMTEKQKNMIQEMNEQARANDAWIPPFTGKTKGEAYNYIHNYLRAIHYSLYNPHEDGGDRV